VAAGPSRVGVRGRLFLVSVALILAVGLTSGVWLEGALSSWLVQRIEGELLHGARASRSLLERVAPAPTFEATDPIADDLGAALDARVTIVAEGGRVLGDSALTPLELEALESHQDRPEIVSALARGVGTSLRFSDSLDTEMLYLAVPWSAATRRGTVRLAVPLATVDQLVGRLRLLLGLAGAVGLVGAVFMSGLASHMMSRGLRRFIAQVSAEGLGEGGRVTITSSDEIGGIAASFNRALDDLERAVAESERARDRFQAALDAMSEAVLAVDAEERLSLSNRAGVAMLALPDASAGQPFEALVASEALRALVTRALGGARGYAEFELRARQQVRATAAPQPAGGCALVLVDITEIRHLERVRRDFVANVSHELKTPVSVVLANAETLLDGALEDPVFAARFTEAIHRNARRLASIIEDLLTLSRLEAGREAFELQPLKLRPFVQRVLAETGERVAGRARPLENQVGEAEAVRADPRALQQALGNLLENAVKYTPAGGHVLVRTSSGAGRLRILVQDDGPGVPAALRERLFERFYRVDPGRSREIGGTGLGLSIVKHLVEQMGGQVGMEPAEGGGSIFWIELPAAAAP